MLSMPIAFKGSKEVGRSTGDTIAASIEALLDKSIEADFVIATIGLGFLAGMLFTLRRAWWR